MIFLGCDTAPQRTDIFSNRKSKMGSLELSSGTLLVSSLRRQGEPMIIMIIITMLFMMIMTILNMITKCQVVIVKLWWFQTNVYNELGVLIFSCLFSLVFFLSKIPKEKCCFQPDSEPNDWSFIFMIKLVKTGFYLILPKWHETHFIPRNVSTFETL